MRSEIVIPEHIGLGLLSSYVLGVLRKINEGTQPTVEEAGYLQNAARFIHSVLDVSDKLAQNNMLALASVKSSFSKYDCALEVSEEINPGMNEDAVSEYLNPIRVSLEALLTGTKLAPQAMMRTEQFFSKLHEYCLLNAGMPLEQSPRYVSMK